jgi:ATP-dependent RNA helicase DHX33
MTGQEEIESTVRTITRINKSKIGSEYQPMVVYPLYASMSSAKQLRVFEPAPKGHRKIIISTNIAETSITINGIKYVIDTGMIKGKLYNPITNIELLKVHRVSKSQAWQRTGRAGRQSDGICYRLFNETEYDNMSLNTVPEILRSNLNSVALQLISLGIDDLLNFDFMSKPSSESLESACNELTLLGAIRLKNKSENDNNDLVVGLNNGAKRQRLNESTTIDNIKRFILTDYGIKMVRYPLDPRLSRCILAANQLGCVEEIIKIVSCLSVETIFHNLANIGGNSANNSKREYAAQIRQKFTSSDGDHITLLNVYKAFVANKNKKVTFVI